MSVRTAEDLQALTDALEDLPVVYGVESAVPGPTDPHVHVCLVQGVERIPPAVLRVLANHDAGISSVSSEGLEPNAKIVVEVAA